MVVLPQCQVESDIISLPGKNKRCLTSTTFASPEEVVPGVGRLFADAQQNLLTRDRVLQTHVTQHLVQLKNAHQRHVHWRCAAQGLIHTDFRQTDSKHTFSTCQHEVDSPPKTHTHTHTHNHHHHPSWKHHALRASPKAHVTAVLQRFNA